MNLKQAEKVTSADNTVDPLAPIALFVYNRPVILRKTLDALKRNPEISRTILFVFSDGPKSPADEAKVESVRNIISEIDWCGGIRIFNSESNKGLARSIMEGVDKVLEEFDSVIVLEDDLLTGTGFLSYMNSALSLYEKNNEVISVSGYVYPVEDRLSGTFFIKGADCLGWATWRRAWSLLVKDAGALHKELMRRDLSHSFEYGGNYPYMKLLEAQQGPKITSWAVLWHASAFLREKLTLYPALSLVKHIGIDGTNYGRDPFLDKINFTDTLHPVWQEPVESEAGRKSFTRFFSERRAYFEGGAAKPVNGVNKRSISPISMIKKAYRKYFASRMEATVNSAAHTLERRLRNEIDEIKIQNGRLLCLQMASLGKELSINDAEFRIFSQWGDDGIIQYLITRVDISNPVFIEFGVQDYTESNTRFLLVNNNWKGLVMDSSPEFIRFIKQDPMYWRHDLTAACEFITAENINALFRENGFGGSIGILSIDIDGNDYWVWKNTNAVDPDIVITEYNSVFGPKHAVTVPYDPSFTRSKAHSSNLYWGASLKALYLLATQKGYVFVGCNSHGNNAYFVKKEKAGKLRALSPEEGYRESRFRESRDEEGNLSYLTGKARLEVIRDMEVFDVENDKLTRIKDLS